jgi:outer membrane protein OmpA-like peptidoglycan-associated protein
MGKFDCKVFEKNFQILPHDKKKLLDKENARSKPVIMIQKQYMAVALLTMLIFSLFIGCASEQTNVTPRNLPSEDEIIKALNRELQALEINGFAGDQTVSEPLYKKWSAQWLNGFKAVLPKVPSGYKVYVTGHADPHGGPAKTDKIAQGRADFIKGRLMKDLGESGKNLATKNYGSQKFEEKKNGPSANRRVEFEIGK